MRLSLKRFSRRQLQISVAISLFLVTLALLSILLAAIANPVWYEPQAVDEQKLSDDKREVVALIDRISRNLNQGLPIDVEVELAQLNRWIAARDELALDLIPELDGVELPFVLGQENILRVAVQRKWRGWRLILSIDLIANPMDPLTPLTAKRVKLGYLPIPLGWLIKEDVLQRSGLRPVEGQEARLWVWPNGKRSFFVEQVAVSKNVVSFRMVPA